MNISLPSRIKEWREESTAYIEDRVLYVAVTEFEGLMYKLTYQMMGEEKCYYCGQPLSSKNRTIDHLYPKDYGGISITNNLVPCCQHCNARKGNMNEKFYREYMELLETTPKLRDEFRMEMATRYSDIRRTMGVDLPGKWYDLVEDFEILAPISSEDRYRNSKKYIRIGDLYETFGRICKPIVISKNNILIGGFNVLMFVKNLPTKVEVPLIKLENVVVH